MVGRSGATLRLECANKRVKRDAKLPDAGSLGLSACSMVTPDVPASNYKQMAFPESRPAYFKISQNGFV
jgi:hypothetical protein